MCFLSSLIKQYIVGVELCFNMTYAIDIDATSSDIIKYDKT